MPKKRIFSGLTKKKQRRGRNIGETNEVSTQKEEKEREEEDGPEFGRAILYPLCLTHAVVCVCVCVCVVCVWCVCVCVCVCAQAFALGMGTSI